MYKRIRVRPNRCGGRERAYWQRIETPALYRRLLCVLEMKKKIVSRSLAKSKRRGDSNEETTIDVSGVKIKNVPNLLSRRNRVVRSTNRFANLSLLLLLLFIFLIPRDRSGAVYNARYVPYTLCPARLISVYHGRTDDRWHANRR